MFSFFRANQLHTAVKLNDMAQVEKLLLVDVDVNAQDEYGWTPLHYAAYYARVEIVKFLLEHGAVESVNKQAYLLKDDTLVGFLSQLELNGGETPLMLTNNASISAMLLKAGANQYMKDAAGWTSLHWGMYRMQGPAISEFVALLLKNETSLEVFNQRNNQGLKPIQLLKSLVPDLIEKWMKEVVEANLAAQALNLEGGPSVPDNLHDWVIDIESPDMESPGASRRGIV